VDCSRCNKYKGDDIYVVSPELIENAEELFTKAKSLIVTFFRWDKNNIPNPESI
jgi:hypothetical protein